MFYEEFTKYVQQTPSKIAVVETQRTISYGELNTFINRVANNLISIGMDQDTKITTCMDNSIEYIALYFAIARIGATIVPLTTTLTEKEVFTFCQQSNSHFIITEEKHLLKFTFSSDTGITSKVIFDNSENISLWDVFNNEGNMVKALEVDPDRDFVVQYTSGTTGLPKGIVQSQRSHVRRMQLWTSTAELTANDRTLCMLSLAHAYGADIVAWPALLTGQTLFLLPIECTEPEQIAKLIDEEGITIFGSLPWFYNGLVETPNIDWYSLSSLRITMCGATPLPRVVAEKFVQIFDLKINNSYGLTETCLITSNLFKSGLEDFMSVGPVIDGVEFKIRDHNLEIPNAGELLVKSEGFAIRYTKECGVELWQDGWIATGDLVKQDENGCFHILARLSEIIPTSAGAILPFEVEEELMKFLGIKEVAVVPLESEGGIFIVAEPGITESDVRQYLNNQSPRFAHIKHIKFMDKFPKSVTGKISKAKLEI